MDSGKSNLAGLTLDAVLGHRKTPSGGTPDHSLQHIESNKTLLDIICEESGTSNGKKSWRNFKEKLRLKRNGSGSAWTSSVRVPTSDIPINNNSMNNRSMMSMNRRPSTRYGDSPSSNQLAFGFDRNSSRASGRFEHSSSLSMKRSSMRPDLHDIDYVEEKDAEGDGSDGGDDDEEEDDEDEEEEEEHPVRMSLMSLLTDSNDDMGLAGFLMGDEEDDDDEDDDDEVNGRGEEYHNCCVCMVRHKGTAFVPCGHSFCRLCSRELWVEKGKNCPLCNNYILEILDIF